MDQSTVWVKDYRERFRGASGKSILFVKHGPGEIPIDSEIVLATCGCKRCYP